VFLLKSGIWGFRLRQQRYFIAYNPIPVACLKKGGLFATLLFCFYFPGQQGYSVVSKHISKSKYQYLADTMSFDTILIYATTP
jgi:hypothetical protein